jgi:hypothetical protein
MVHFSVCSLYLLLEGFGTKVPFPLYTGSIEKKLIDLTTLRQRNSETPLEFLRRFRETNSMCFSLNLLDDQLASMAVAGMLPAITSVVIDEQPGLWI